MILSRDAVYTSQPRELLYELSFENGKYRKVLSGDLGSCTPSGDILSNNHDAIHSNGAVGTANSDENVLKQNQETMHAVDMEGSQG